MIIVAAAPTAPHNFDFFVLNTSMSVIIQIEKRRIELKENIDSKGSGFEPIAFNS